MGSTNYLIWLTNLIFVLWNGWDLAVIRWLTSLVVWWWWTSLVIGLRWARPIT